MVKDVELAPFKNAKGVYEGSSAEMLKAFDEAVSDAFHIDPAYVGFCENFTVDELFPIFQKGVEFGKQLALNTSKELKQDTKSQKSLTRKERQRKALRRFEDISKGQQLGVGMKR